MVNEQLSQLYLDMELEGLSAKLSLEESISLCGSSSISQGSCSSSSSSGGEETQPTKHEEHVKSKKFFRVRKNFILNFCNV